MSRNNLSDSAAGPVMTEAEPGPGTPGLKQRLAAWYQASRPPFYIATLVPLFLGLVLAHQVTGQWRPGRFLLINLGAFAVHLATNLADDLFDHLLGADAGESIGGSRVIQQGLITVGQLAWALVILYSVGLVTALILVEVSGQTGVWILAILAGLSSLFYVAPPIKYGYRGLGEVSVFLNMGLVMVGGTFWVLAEHWDWRMIWYSLPVGLMVANILYFQSLPDMKTDRQVGKYTLAVLLGKARAARLFRLWWAAVYASLAGLGLSGLVGWPVWLSLVTIPLFLKTDRLVHTTEDWLELDRHGHLVRKLYMLNGLVLILAAAM